MNLWVVFFLACAGILFAALVFKYLLVIGALLAALAFGGWVAYKIVTQNAPK